MGTRSNLYKNPSFAYNKHLNLNSALQNLKAYNAATGTGNATPAEEPPNTSVPDRIVVNKKRHREKRPPPDQSKANEDHDGPMSHHQYIEKRRRELNPSQPYQELTADLLETSTSGAHLVGYESDTSTSSEHDEKQNSQDLDTCRDIQPLTTFDNEGEADRVKNRSEQRFPVPGEPVCVVCGKYGEYICNETDDDICSIDCKSELLENLKQSKGKLSSQNPIGYSSGPEVKSQIPHFGDSWDYSHHDWYNKSSGLCTYKCWKCQKPGHLAEDCLVTVRSLSSGETCSQIGGVQHKPGSISRDLLELYKRCHQLGKNLSGVRCNSCRSSISLASCLECSNAFCDSSGHLSEHINRHPTHRQYYSFKLKRLVKCCKSTCKVTDIKDLLACHYCFDKAFDKFYDMYTATWKAAGLSIILGSICCEDHFDWHRMNCLNADVDDSAYIVRKHQNHPVQLSDFIF